MSTEADGEPEPQSPDREFRILTAAAARRTVVLFGRGEAPHALCRSTASLKSARGDRPATAHAAAEYETYLQALLYDHFDQRVYQRVGSGVVTTYTYEPLTRRLAAR
jgi:hypothetical protein